MAFLHLAEQIVTAVICTGLAGSVALAAEVLQDPLAGPEGAPAVLAETAKKCGRLWPRLEAALAAAGQAALLQSHIAYQLCLHARCEPHLQQSDWKVDARNPYHTVLRTCIRLQVCGVLIFYDKPSLEVPRASWDSQPDAYASWCALSQTKLV